MKRASCATVALLAGVAAIAVPSPARSADATAGREKAKMCQTCHGIEGVGKMPDVPNIGGESASYLSRQLVAFRSGERRHEQMSVIAEGLSDADIADVAAWYASIEFSVTLPK